MQNFMIYTIGGLVLGGIYALTAVGYSMVYGILELVNFAHGTIYMIGAFLFYLLNVSLGIPGLVSFFLAVVLTGILGIAYERLALRPLRIRNLPKFCFLICTIGVSYFLENIFFVFLGSESRLYPTMMEDHFIKIGGINITVVQIVTIITSVVLMLVLTWFVKKTPTGMAMRATAENRTATQLMGISVDNIVSITFFLGSALAAVAGIFTCMTYRSVSTSIGVTTGTKTFAATVLGGIGEIKGAVIGGLIIGLTESYTSGYIGSEYRNMVAFILLIIVLLFKPNGLFGKPVQKKV